MGSAGPGLPRDRAEQGEKKVFEEAAQDRCEAQPGGPDEPGNLRLPKPPGGTCPVGEPRAACGADSSLHRLQASSFPTRLDIWIVCI